MACESLYCYANRNSWKRNSSKCRSLHSNGSVNRTLLKLKKGGKNALDFVNRLFKVSPELLGIYRERLCDPDFWAEPLNALTNASFFIAAFLALDHAKHRNAVSRMTIGLLLLTGMIGVGSFCFHTIPNHFTMWLDIAPIALFQVSFLWLASNKMLSMNRLISAGIVVGVLGLSFALMPLHEAMNGSLFYVPSFVAMLAIGIMWGETSRSEPYLLLGAAFYFLLALIARSIDWSAPWRFGTHFLWHVLNGVVVYMALRAWIVFVSLEESMAVLDTPLTEPRSTIGHERATQE